MKKVIILSVFALASIVSFSQSEKYIKAMEPKVAMVDSAKTPQQFSELAAAFERIADAEKTQWLPYYYAALAHVDAGLRTTMGKSGMAAITDPIADKAEALITKAEALSKDNSEIYIVKKMIATLRMTADPMSRYMQYGPQAQEALETAIKLNPENPRAFLLQGQDKYFTPAQFGGDKEEAMRLFKTALLKYDAAKVNSTIGPHWGKATTEYFISLGSK